MPCLCAAGPATNGTRGGLARLLLAPDVPAVRALAEVLAKALACPQDRLKRVCPTAMPNTFHCMFIPRTAPLECAVRRGPGPGGRQGGTLPGGRPGGLGVWRRAWQGSEDALMWW